MDTPSLEDMPAELLELIADELSDQDVLDYCQTSRSFKVLCDAQFWRLRAVRKGYIKTPQDFGPESSWPQESARERYIELSTIEGNNCIPGSEKYTTTCMERAVAEGNKKLINYLISVGYDLYTILIIAILKGKLDMVDYLISKGEITDFNNMLAIAVSQGAGSDILKHLISKGKNTDLTEALLYFVLYGKSDIVKYVVEQEGENLNLNAAALMAGFMHDKELIKYLIQKGALESAAEEGMEDSENAIYMYDDETGSDIPDPEKYIEYLVESL